jgi:diguanylate cyclase (GGDEF)-like protein
MDRLDVPVRGSRTTSSSATLVAPAHPCHASEVEPGSGVRAAEIERYGLGDPRWGLALRDVALMAAAILGEDRGAVTVVGDSTTWSLATTGGGAFEVANDVSYCSLVADEGRCIAFADTAIDPLATARSAQLPTSVRRYAGAPFLSPAGIAVGAVCAWGPSPREVTDVEALALHALARQAQQVLELDRQSRQLHADRVHHKLLAALLSAIMAGHSLADVLADLARAVEEQAPDVLCSVMLVEDGLLRTGAAPSLPAAFVDAIDGVAIGEDVGSCGRAAATGRPAVTGDIATDPRWRPFRDLALDCGLKACWSVPVFDQSGRVVATFGLYYRSHRRPSSEHWRAMHDWAKLAALAIQRATEHEHLRRSARTDALTGLANRATILADIESAIVHARAGSPPAVLLCDLDGFKVLNDSLGHVEGDAYLVHLAERLQAAELGEVSIGRLGGDAFVVVDPVAGDCSKAARLARQILDVVHQPTLVAGRPVLLSGSVGIALAEPGDTAGDLLRHADAAMYAAKTRSRNGYAMADEHLRRRITDRMELELDLRAAIEHGEITLVYQPKVDLCTGALVGVEALARWQHRVRGSIPPDVFVPIAEESGTIVDLGARVLHQACTEYASRLRRDPRLGAGRIWVNVSTRQLDRDLLSGVCDALASAGLPCSRLGLEITESAFMGDRDSVAAASEVLSELRRRGVEIAVDDFGTGYSSLAQLRHLPVDVLKIDKAFVDRIGADEADDRVVGAIVRLGDALGLRVVAEGIETEPQRRRLLALGCGYGQGYLFGRPAPLDDALPCYHVARGRDTPGQCAERPPSLAARHR